MKPCRCGSLPLPFSRWISSPLLGVQQKRALPLRVAEARRALLVSGSFDGSLRATTWTEPEPERRGWKRVLVRAPERHSILFGGSPSPSEWNLDTRTLMAPFTGQHTASAVSLAVSPDGRSMATGGFGGHLHLWDRTTRRSVARWPAEQGDGVWAVAFLPDGRLLSAGNSGTIRVWLCTK